MATKLTQEQSTDLLCKHYGVVAHGNVEANVKALSTVPEFQKAYRDTLNVGAALTRIATNVNANATVNAWFFQNGGTKKDWDTKKWVEHKGIQALLPDGRVFPVDAPQSADAKQLKTTLQLTGVKTVTHILEGRTEIKNIGKAVGTYVQHDDPIPEVSPAQAIDACMAIDKRAGTIYGQTNFPHFVSCDVGTDNYDVSYWPAGNYAESLTVTAYADVEEIVDGEATRKRLAVDIGIKDVQAVRDMFGLGQDADKDDFHAAIAGDRVFARGLTTMVSNKGSDFFEDGEMDSAIQQLENAGMMDSYDSKNGKCYRMNLSKQDNTHILLRSKKEGKEVRVMGLEYTFDKRVNEMVWSASVHNHDLGKNLKMYTHSTNYVKSVKNEETNEIEQVPEVWNPGAFVLFGSSLGGAQARVADEFADIHVDLNSFGADVPAAPAAPAAPTPDVTATPAPAAAEPTFKLTN